MTKQEALKAACESPDWQQIILNGGPPCFHLEEEGSFCLRAQRWAGDWHGRFNAAERKKETGK